MTAPSAERPCQAAIDEAVDFPKLSLAVCRRICVRHGQPDYLGLALLSLADQVKERIASEHDREMHGGAIIGCPRCDRESGRIK